MGLSLHKHSREKEKAVQYTLTGNRGIPISQCPLVVLLGLKVDLKMMLYVSTVAILDGRHPYCCNIYCSKNDGNLCFSLFFLRKKAKEFEYKFLRYQAQILKN